MPSNTFDPTRKGPPSICEGCERGEECRAAELTPCSVLRDEYIHGYNEACASFEAQAIEEIKALRGRRNDDIEGAIAFVQDVARKVRSKVQ